jgi:hypothetical protein
VEWQEVAMRIVWTAALTVAFVTGLFTLWVYLELPDVPRAPHVIHRPQAQAGLLRFDDDDLPPELPIVRMA